MENKRKEPQMEAAPSMAAGIAQPRSAATPGGTGNNACVADSG